MATRTANTPPTAGPATSLGISSVERNERESQMSSSLYEYINTYTHTYMYVVCTCVSSGEVGINSKRHILRWENYDDDNFAVS